MQVNIPVPCPRRDWINEFGYNTEVFFPRKMMVGFSIPPVLQDPSESVFWAGFQGLNTENVFGAL